MTVRTAGRPASPSSVIECEHCGRPFEVEARVGRPRKYCRRSCRQRAFERRRHQGDLVWGDARLISMARELAEAEDAIDRARHVIDEVRMDLEDGRVPATSVLLERLEAALRHETGNLAT